MSKIVPLFIQDVRRVNKSDDYAAYCYAQTLYEWFQAWCQVTDTKCVSQATFYKHLNLADLPIRRTHEGNFVLLLGHKTFGVDTGFKGYEDPVARYYNDTEKVALWQDLLN